MIYKKFINIFFKTFILGQANIEKLISLIRSLAKILDSLNFFHPFREGNGRTQREVIRALAISKGYRAQIRVSDDDIIYNTYMDGTVYGDLQKLESLFELILEKI